jgi:hypothetical protein
MVSEIRIYTEGGGDERATRNALRRGFSGFLEKLRSIARRKNVRWSLIACGGRNRAYDCFVRALSTHPTAFNLLLVDSETPVTDEPWDHLAAQDDWSRHGTSDEHCQLMVQVMESWFIADIEALRHFYGNELNENPIPQRNNVERVAKANVFRALERATETTSKGRYHKTRHAPQLLRRIDFQRVCDASRHCTRLFNTLYHAISGEDC